MISEAVSCLGLVLDRRWVRPRLREASRLVSIVTIVAISQLMPTALAGTTHLNVPDGAMVTLTLGSLSDRCPRNGDSVLNGLTLVDPGGVRTGKTFEVPKGLTLIVTDVVWSVRGRPFERFIPPRDGPGVTITPRARSLRLRLYVPAPGPPEATTVFLSRPLQIGAETELLFPGDSENLTAGIRIGEGQELCAAAQAESASENALFPNLDLHQIDRLYIYGYLTTL